MIRVLHVIDSMDCGGGAQAMLMNYYRHIDRSKVQFDFATHWNLYGEKAQYEDEITALGGRIYPITEDRIRHPLRYIRWWKNFFREHPGYAIVEGHILTSAIIYLAAARRAGCHTVAHSHCTWNRANPNLHDLCIRCSIWPLRWMTDDFVACSLEAGTDFFGTRVAHSDRFRVVNNAIDCERFAFSSAGRQTVRDAFGLTDEYLIGHVGRFATQKNHIRLLHIFKAVHERLPSARLMLLGGKGPLNDKVRQACRQMGLDSFVIFAGLHENIEDYYSAMDVFCFPTLYEGLGMVAVEAQTSGLPCVVSDATPKVADIGAGLFEVLSLAQSDDEWAEAVLAQRQKERNVNGVEYARQAGYDVERETKSLQEYYLTRGSH